MKTMTAAPVLVLALCAGCGKQSSPVSQQPPPGSVIAAGASLTVRTTNPISTANVKSGDSFAANLEVPLKDGDRVLVPKGALVAGRVVNADPGGQAKGKARISVQLSEMEAAGQIVRVSTNTIEREARAAKGKDAAIPGESVLIFELQSPLTIPSTTAN